MPLKAVLDANVLFPFTLRDTLLRAAEAGLFQVYWSEQILDEVCRNLVEKTKMSEKQAGHLRAEMEQAFPEAMVQGHEKLIARMKNDPKDRHVAAAAQKAKVQNIVTDNLKDFRKLSAGIHAISADAFLQQLLAGAPSEMLKALRDQAAALKKPSRTFEDLLAGLEKSVPGFAKAVRGISKQP